jgi:hypothetical protein
MIRMSLSVASAEQGRWRRSSLTLLSPEASFVNGAIVPVDGRRAVLGHDPESRSVHSASRSLRSLDGV